MKISENNLQATIIYFKNQLTDFYDESEINSMLSIVLNYYFGITRTEIVLDNKRLFSESDLLKIIFTVKELKKLKPLAYILGEWEFYGLKLKVDKSTLIPRPETEELVALVVGENPVAQHIIDIGTGSGCIALAIKSQLKASNVYAWDVSDEALVKVAENARLNDLTIHIEQVDILTSKNKILDFKVDVIVSNPPYIPNNEKELMNKNVLDYEPHLALFVADNNPVLFYDAIADFALINLNSTGKLYFEVNENYAEEVAKLLEKKNMKDVLIIKDINEKNRIVKGSL